MWHYKTEPYFKMIPVLSKNNSGYPRPIQRQAIDTNPYTLINRWYSSRITFVKWAWIYSTIKQTKFSIVGARGGHGRQII